MPEASPPSRVFGGPELQGRYGNRYLYSEVPVEGTDSAVARSDVALVVTSLQDSTKIVSSPDLFVMTAEIYDVAAKRESIGGQAHRTLVIFNGNYVLPVVTASRAY
jgi:hypothetical protein